MRQLSGTDSLFLALERGSQHAHVAGLSIYDPSTAPGGVVRFKRILEFFASRLNAAKLFRSRLVHVPFGLDRPYWVGDADIDIEYHIRHIALPHPGDWRQLCIQVARIHSRPLDLTRPAWEAYVIEGLDNIPGVPHGSFAMYLKLHHSAIDGEAGAVLIKAIHSLTPEPEEPSTEPEAPIADPEPTAIELLSRTVGSRFKQTLAVTDLLADIAPVALAMGRKQLEAVLTPPEADGPDQDEATRGKPPVTRFNAPLSPHRVIEAIPFAMDEVRKIRQAFEGVTVNDVFMAACAGALRRYLEAKGELPDTALIAFVPMTTRGSVKDAEAGNQIGMAEMPLFTQVADDAKRLQMIHLGSRKGKRAAEALGKDLPAKLFQVLPTALARYAQQYLITPRINLTISNVRGPDVPLYMAGARLHAFMPISMLLDGMGLNITGFSYNGVLWICAVSDRAMMPDPGFFAECFRDSIAALQSAAVKTARGAERAAAKSPKSGSTASAATPTARADGPKRTRKATGPRTAAKKATRRTAKRSRKLAAD